MEFNQKANENCYHSWRHPLHSSYVLCPLEVTHFFVTEMSFFLGVFFSWPYTGSVSLAISNLMATVTDVPGHGAKSLAINKVTLASPFRRQIAKSVGGGGKTFWDTLYNELTKYDWS
jgi:hypothetical protein